MFAIFISLPVALYVFATSASPLIDLQSSSPSSLYPTQNASIESSAYVTTNIPNLNNRHLEVYLKFPTKPILPTRQVLAQLERQRQHLLHLREANFFTGFDRTEQHTRVVFKPRKPNVGETPITGLTNGEAVEVMEKLERNFRWGEHAPEIHFGVEIENVIVALGGVVG